MREEESLVFVPVNNWVEKKKKEENCCIVKEKVWNVRSVWSTSKQFFSFFFDRRVLRLFFLLLLLEVGSQLSQAIALYFLNLNHINNFHNGENLVDNSLEDETGDD